jgi:hypothetical protein
MCLITTTEDSCDNLMNMDDQLRSMAESRYKQTEFLKTLFELALEENWFELQHVIQHDMAKAVIADYSLTIGKGYFDSKIFFDNWEEVIDIGWRAFSEHTGISMEKVKAQLSEMRNAI